MLRENGHVEAARERDLDERIRLAASRGFRGSKARDGQCKPDLRACAGERPCRHPQRDIVQRPGRWGDARELELHGQVVAVPLDVRVHTVGKRGEDLARLGVVDRELAVVPGALILNQPEEAIVLDSLRADDLGQAPAVVAPPQLHLPQTVLRLHVALREEQVVGVLGVDVGDAPAIADDVDRVAKPRNHELAVDLAQRRFRQLDEARVCRPLGRRHDSREHADRRGEQQRHPPHGVPLPDITHDVSSESTKGNAQVAALRGRHSADNPL